MQQIKVQNLSLKEWRDLSPYLNGLNLISISAGPGNSVFVLTAIKPTDYREQTSGPSFVKINPDHPQDFVVLKVGETEVSRYEVTNQRWNYHCVQPLPNEELLLVCARSRFRARNDYDLNAKVFSYDGKLRREFLLGDGIEDVQVTAEGQIWVSYFDEGVFGNYGWREPVGAPGLIRWDSFGKQVYQFSSPAGLDSICDCYALNVVSNTETWCYYYTEFPLVQIEAGRIKAHWNCPIRGSHRFIVWRDWVLFQGGYEAHDLYHLFRLGTDGQMTLLAIYQLVDSSGDVLKSRQIVARGCFLYLLVENLCYSLDLRELVISK